jgi:RNase P subunit RPR2
MEGLSRDDVPVPEMSSARSCTCCKEVLVREAHTIVTETGSYVIMICPQCDTVRI